jgi:hypothetical protein
MDIIASGSHNGGGLDMTILNGLQPGLTRGQAASLRGISVADAVALDRKFKRGINGLGSSVPPEGEGGSAFGILWLFAIFGGVGYLAYRSDEKKRRSRRK